MDRAALEDEFVAKLRAAWTRGAAEYGDASFKKPVAMLASEILQEAVDVAGWAFVLWVSLRERLARIQVSDESANAGQALHDWLESELVRIGSFSGDVTLIMQEYRRRWDAMVSTSAGSGATLPPPPCT